MINFFNKKDKKDELILTKEETLYILKERAIKLWQKETLTKDKKGLIKK